MVHTLAGKRDRMVRTGFFQSDSCGGRLTVWCARRQALVQIKLESAQRDLNLFCLFNMLVSVKAAFINRHEPDSVNRNISFFLNFLNLGGAMHLCLTQEMVQDEPDRCIELMMTAQPLPTYIYLQVCNAE